MRDAYCVKKRWLMDERDEFLIQEYVDGELDEAQIADVEALLAKSIEARDFLAALHAFNSQFTLMTDVPMTADLSTPIVQQIETQSLFTQTSTIGLRLLLLAQIAVTAVLMWQQLPRLNDWLANGRFALDTIITDIQLPSFTFAQLWAGWETAVFEQTDQLIPIINLPPQQWALIILVVSVIWLTGNRLLFTNNNGGSHG